MTDTAPPIGPWLAGARDNHRSPRRRAVSAWPAALALSLPAALALTLPAVLAADPAAPGPAAAPPDHLEGIYLGQSQSPLETRFGLGGMVPFRDGDGQRFVLSTELPLPDKARRELQRLEVSRLELRFHGGIVASVRVEYDGRREVRFDEMEAQLAGSYGPPGSVQERGPMQVGRAHGVRLYLWLRIWSWEWPDRRLVVEGKHYGDDKREEEALRHAYVFTLSRPPSG